MSEEESFGDPGFESGPFCRHWSDPVDCEECRELCSCGHEARDHGESDGDPCGERACPCGGFSALPPPGAPGTLVVPSA